MATFKSPDQIKSETEILQRDSEVHPPEHAPDINTFNNSDLKLMQETNMDHPASHVEISIGMHEREVQPFNGH